MENSNFPSGKPFSLTPSIRAWFSIANGWQFWLDEFFLVRYWKVWKALSQQKETVSNLLFSPPFRWCGNVVRSVDGFSPAYFTTRVHISPCRENAIFPLEFPFCGGKTGWFMVIFPIQASQWWTMSWWFFARRSATFPKFGNVNSQFKGKRFQVQVLKRVNFQNLGKMPKRLWQPIALVRAGKPQPFFRKGRFHFFLLRKFRWRQFFQNFENVCVFENSKCQNIETPASWYPWAFRTIYEKPVFLISRTVFAKNTENPKTVPNLD